MSNRLIIVGMLIIVIGFAALTFYVLSSMGDNDLSQSEAVALVQQTYPELADYPADSLPPRSIVAEQSGGNWHLAFIEEGSGVPIISARCFLVQGDGAMWERGYTPAAIGDGLNFSAKTCTGSAAVGNNTNVPITNSGTACGPNPAQFCTAMYALGDKCRSYASCSNVSGSCGLITSQQFDTCKSCVETCLSEFPENIEQQFQCESEC